MKKKIIIGNWKMHPTSVREAEQLAINIREQLPTNNAIVVIAPPFPFLPSLAALFPAKRGAFALGAQDAFWENAGAYTGAVSPLMLKKLGVRYVLLGHSERRQYQAETNAMVNKKISSCLKQGLSAVLCVGERARDDDGRFPPEVKEELVEGLRGVPKTHLDKLLIAYEPIWAIGKGKKADTPEDFFAMMIYIRRTLFDIVGRRWAEQIPIIYGGSVGAENAASFLAVEGASGILVGRASLNPNVFARITAHANEATHKQKV